MMNTLIKIGKAFSEEPKTRSVGFRNGFLAVILVLLALAVLLPSQNHFRRLIFPIMLLLNHLAFQFKWPRPVMIGLRACTCIWLMFFVVFYWP